MEIISYVNADKSLFLRKTFWDVVLTFPQHFFGLQISQELSQPLREALTIIPNDGQFLQRLVKILLTARATERSAPSRLCLHDTLAENPIFPDTLISELDRPGVNNRGR